MAHSLLAGRGGSEKRTYLNKTAREGDRECIKQSRQLTAIEFVRLCFGADNDDVIYSKTLCFVVAVLSLSHLQLHWTTCFNISRNCVTLHSQHHASLCTYSIHWIAGQ